MKMKFKKMSLSSLPCFYCSTDESQLKMILFLIIGSFILGSVCILVWSIAHGVFKNVEQSKYEVFDADRRE